MKKNIIGVVVLLTALGIVSVLISRGAPVSEQVAVASSLMATETTYDFGSISMKNGTVRREFLVKNPGISPVMIEKLYTSCMCTNAELRMGEKKYGPYGMPGHGAVPKVRAELGAGQEAVVTVIFDPAAHGPAGVGPISRVVFLEDAAGGSLQLQFSANVTP